MSGTIPLYILTFINTLQYHHTVQNYMYTRKYHKFVLLQVWYYDNDFIIWITAHLDVAVSDF